MSPRTLLSASIPFVLLPHDAPRTPTATGPPTNISVFLTHSPADDTLTLTLSDLSTRLLLLHHVLTATRYAPLRESQSLLIDFAAFPNHLCDLFHRVSSASDYVATLRLPPISSGTPSTPPDVSNSHDIAVLRVVQTSAVKSITHIELTLRRASHEELVSAVAARAREAQLAEDRVNELQNTLKQQRDQALQDTRTAEQSIQQLKDNISRLENRLQHSQEIDARATRLDEEVRRLSQSLNEAEVQARNARIEADAVIDVQGEVERLRQLVETAQSENGRIDDALQRASAERDEARRESDRIRSERDEATAEIAKGNAIIERLQSEVHTARAKNKVKAAVIARQEQTVRRLESRVAELERDVRRARDQVALLEVEKDGLNSRLTSALRKLEENAAVLASDQQVIAYLNRELNERAAGDIGATTQSPTRDRRRSSGRDNVGVTSGNA